MEKIGYEGQLTDSIKKDIVAHPNLFDGILLTDAKKYIRENIKNQTLKSPLLQMSRQYHPSRNP